MSVTLIEDAVDALDSAEASKALAELLEDRARLDFLQQQGGGRLWVSRPSATGRGYRVYTETSRMGAFKTLRDAIDFDRKQVEDGLGMWERQKFPEQD